jgi:hypothetical protein
MLGEKAAVQTAYSQALGGDFILIEDATMSPRQRSSLRKAVDRVESALVTLETGQDTLVFAKGHTLTVELTQGARMATPGFPLLNAPQTDSSAGLWPKARPNKAQKLRDWARTRNRGPLSKGALHGREYVLTAPLGQNQYIAASCISKVPPRKPPTIGIQAGDWADDWEF